jgi:hypothetical protein
MATTDEIERLKHSWLGDPCWNIEETEGFEEHREELLAFRKETEAKAEKRNRERIERRAKVIREETGVTTKDAAMYLHTFAEIETEVNGQDRAISDAPNQSKMAEARILQAQVRAILLLAAQFKRLVDHLEKIEEERNADEQRQELRELYRVR